MELGGCQWEPVVAGCSGTLLKAQFRLQLADSGESLKGKALK